MCFFENQRDHDSAGCLQPRSRPRRPVCDLWSEAAIASFLRYMLTPVEATTAGRFASKPARSPWQNCYVERVIGSIRRKCLNHLIVINDNHLPRILKDYFSYYHESRTHLSLDKDTPGFRAVQSTKSERIIQIPQVGGHHHRYERRAA